MLVLSIHTQSMEQKIVVLLLYLKIKIHNQYNDLLASEEFSGFSQSWSIEECPRKARLTSASHTTTRSRPLPPIFITIFVIFITIFVIVIIKYTINITTYWPPKSWKSLCILPVTEHRGVSTEGQPLSHSISIVVIVLITKYTTTSKPYFIRRTHLI